MIDVIDEIIYPGDVHSFHAFMERLFRYALPWVASDGKELHVLPGPRSRNRDSWIVVWFSRDSARADALDGMASIQAFQELPGHTVIQFVDDHDPMGFEDEHVSIGNALGELCAFIAGQSPLAPDRQSHRLGLHTVSEQGHLEAQPVGDFLFRRSADVWEIAYEGARFHAKDIKGMSLIHALLSRPGHYYPPVELEIAAEGDAAETLGLDEREELEEVSNGGTDQMVIDERAKREYEVAIEQLKNEKKVAELERNLPRVNELEERIDFIEDCLRKSTGLGGKPRKFADDFNRARVRVTQAIQRAVNRIEQDSPHLAKHLREYIETGSRCVYRLPPPEEISWEL